MKQLMVVITVVTLACGCSDKGDQARDPLENVAFVVMDGKPLTAAFVKKSVLIRAKIAEFAGKPIKGAKFAQWANSTAMRMVGSIINAQLIDKEVAKRCIQPAEEDVRQTLESYNRQTKKNAATKEELAAHFGDLKEDFLRQFDQTVHLTAFERVQLKFDVPEEMVRTYFQIVSNEQTKAENANALAKKKGNALYARLKAGERWEDVAKESEDKLLNTDYEQYATFWANLPEDALGVKELSVALSKMKVGDFTEPLDTIFGLIIVRLDGKEKGIFKVSRILVRMSMPVHIPKCYAEAEEIVRRKMASSRQRMILKRLERQTTFEYPLGTNFVYKIWKDESVKKEKDVK